MLRWAGNISRRLVVASAVCFVMAASACSHGSGDRNSTADARALPLGVVVLKPAGRTVRVRVELASRSADRARGLMFRRELEPLSGMLFIFERAEEHPFWMKNTYISLDMIFIGDDHRVVGTVENTAPLTETPRTVAHPSRYVLEVNAGFVAAHGIVRGTPVELVDVPHGAR